MKLKSICFKPNNEDLNIINFTMNKYNINQTEAMRWLIHNKESNIFYIEEIDRQKEFNVKHVLDMKNALNHYRKTGSIAMVEEVMEEFKCQALL